MNIISFAQCRCSLEVSKESSVQALAAPLRAFAKRYPSCCKRKGIAFGQPRSGSELQDYSSERIYRQKATYLVARFVGSRKLTAHLPVQWKLEAKVNRVDNVFGK